MTPVEAARQVLGVPFRHQGRNRLGMDCAGVLVHIFREMGVPFNDELGYPRHPYDGQLERILDAQPSLERIDPRSVEAGDVVAMRMAKAPQHIAIHAGLIDGHPYIIHGSEQHGKVALHRLDDLWGARIVRAYRVLTP